MIENAEEFVRLRTSEVEAEYHRAAHEEAPMAVWRQVIDEVPEMKSWVAHNKTVPLEILEILAHDCDDAVRHAVAMKRKLSRELFNLLATDKDPSVRARIAYNAKAPDDILERLASDPEDFVKEAAQTKLAARREKDAAACLQSL